MDRPRENTRRMRLLRRATYGIVAFGLVAALAIVPSRLKPAAYPVERSSIWTGTVETGSMTREVKGQGTLVPVDVLWIPAATDGRVERRFAQAGDRVTPETVLLVLANPELQLAALDAEYEWKAGEARLVDLQVQLRSERLNQEAEAARLDAEYQTAALRAHRDTSLNNEGLLVDLTAKTSQLAVEQLAKRKEIEAKRMAITHEAVEAQLAAQSANVARLEALRQFRRAQVEALSVKAGVAGVLQELSVEVGQRVSAGAILAKVVQPSRLKAELRIAETQANDVTIGQNAVIDTRNSTIQGVVSRVDPSAREGTVTVDVKLQGPLPAGARPDLSVTGTIEIEHLTGITYMPRPTGGQTGATVGLYRVDADGIHATRVPVKLGRASATTIEVLEGLAVGDQVILSDTATWDRHDRIQLR